MPIGKLGVGVGLLALAAGGWYWMSSLPPPLTCNAPALIQEFQGRFQENRRQGMAVVRARNDDAMLSHYAHAVLHIHSTVTLGSSGNFLSCEMTFDRGDPDFTHTYTYLLGFDDAGHLTWRSSDLAPYEMY